MGQYVVTCNFDDESLKKLTQFFDKMGWECSIGKSLRGTPDAVQPLFRFEMFFDGAYQGAGLFQELDNLFEPAVYRKLLKPFKDELPVPMEVTQPCSFWFTEAGVQRFGCAIDEINKCALEVGWEVKCSVLWVHEINYLYEDEYQVALGEEFINIENFYSFSRTADLLLY